MQYSLGSIDTTRTVKISSCVWFSKCSSIRSRADIYFSSSSFHLDSWFVKWRRERIEYKKKTHNGLRIV